MYAQKLNIREVGRTTVPVSVFDAAYAGTERFLGRYEKGVLPWEISAPQAGVIQLARSGMITGRVLDLGCGTGENALFLAAEGFDVLGVDASSIAIERARAKARDRDLPVRFAVGDALDVSLLGETFDTVVDSGMLHVFSEQDRSLVIAGVHAVLVPGGRYHVLCFSHKKALPAPRLSHADIVASFARGWLVESLTEARYHVLDGDSSDNAWLVSCSRL